MKEYNHQKIEQKWRKRWDELGLNKTAEDAKKPKCYVLDMFPYPSGDGLHVGHPKGYIATDAYSRMKRMKGFNVLHPMGWDAFGLPAEQFAIKNKVHPSTAVEKNTKRFKEQLAEIGFNYDWERELNTTDPKYYRWTQWIFLQMYKKGLAYESFEPINWCPSCQTGLANEDLEGGKCERCGTVVVKKPMRQWVLRITDYAERLLKDLDTLSWPESIKESQRNWIGKSEGAEFEFPLSGISGQEEGKHKVTVFTTRPDTLFGATYVAISAELGKKWLDVGWKADKKVADFIERTLREEAVRAYDVVPEKEGIATGVYAENPANKEKIPVWIANYVLSGYGTGAIMAVPAHDERDFAFAKKYDLPIRMVICPNYPEPNCPILDEAYVGGGHLVGSGKFIGTKSDEAKALVTAHAGGKKKTTYKLKDWVFSRQRYWGEPIPLIHCAKDGVVPVPEKELPVLLPDVESYVPTGTGESPLADIAEWVNTTCPKCGGPAKRETNTMPQWAGSSWYYLRYIDPKNTNALVDPKKERYWSPVDLYVGGAEHATRHLIYARFWHKFLHDIGVVAHLEPFARLQNVGLIIAPDGRKMSKRFGNIVNPDLIVERFGADSLRVYEMFMGPFDQSIVWSTDNLVGARRFLERVFRLSLHIDPSQTVSPEGEFLMHQTIMGVERDIESFKLNTAISKLMIYVGFMEKEEKVPAPLFEVLLKLLAPFAPHLAEELWSGRHEGSIHTSLWPHFDPAKVCSSTAKITIQVNGKLRGTMEIDRSLDEKDARRNAESDPEIKKWLAEKTVKKVIYIPERTINFVVE
ncbi:MAG: leucine--tRNA ligase [Candidatus Lloydbacteria bacterium RIFCSPHIGHO2_02_FULL_54_17]|uniref:Leucine--tRNA ligase n=1 Tax=Candidatus Lloydbacteria bacterium RIFCSPHIGHO2_02_FULL_54_17 TaxID=1798664 RepID=A0A1G2DCE9_9BACT|nr:MAG: leucine--tRNA ligase [Candidatus Lloydbacteria bacterium RIFCSPHIGHO2_01_FULL_54_11]OGZ10611.1 MAG: leucine--tRNA ligase [Candidatus Lloydbacteria bacterium RIFCSPHIGHO2_02_FULL_54_17]OGZ13646.1 MAG: leucine--tRNA ligase [Candidatus Lloydbacteria bacterium RIFCSPLOWO2_01_FULL_54_18]OGZ16083.1 MAG: leucine--tRNA ligase [Candidatus Lloydbacteria bacterium RIFCSPLOWO2_02_FULL_54_12]